MVSLFFISVVVVVLLTPGPTNTLLASSSIQVGIHRSLKLIPAEVLGYLLAISLWGVLIKVVSAPFPWLPALLKLCSAVFIFFLAIRLWTTAKQMIDVNQPTIRASALFLATVLNPKALLFASAVFPEQSWHVAEQYVWYMGMFLLLITPIAFFWIVFGHILVANRIHWLNQCNLQRFASVVLIAFSIPMTVLALSSF